MMKAASSRRPPPADNVLEVADIPLLLPMGCAASPIRRVDAAMIVRAMISAQGAHFDRDMSRAHCNALDVWSSPAQLSATVAVILLS
jgi:hypothetical protein